MKTLFCFIALFISFSDFALAQVDTSDVHVSTEVLPEPECGWQAYYQFLGKEIKFPKTEREAGVEGKAIIQFVVEKDGSISGVEPLPGTEDKTPKAMIDEAVRVIKLSPKWKPGMQDGVPVRCKYFIPIRFGLTEEEKTEKERKWWQRKK